MILLLTGLPWLIVLILKITGRLPYEYDYLILVGPVISGVGIIIHITAEKVSYNRFLRKASEEYEERQRQLAVNPMLIHEEAISDYVATHQRVRESPSPYSAAWEAACRGALLGYITRIGGMSVAATTEARTKLLENATQMQRVFFEILSADKNLSTQQVQILRNSFVSALHASLAKEAEARAREEERKKAQEIESAQRQKAAAERSDREQRLLKARLGKLYSSIWNANEGRLPIEEALKTNLPEQHCFVYSVVVGGESYVGYTTATPEAAMNDHVSAARRGSGEPLHKALRRFGYVFETEVLAESGNEVAGLLARLSYINKLKPELNRPFEGAGSEFDLIESINEFGENVLFVENKRVTKARASIQRRSNPEYLRAVVAQIERRYAQLEDGYRMTRGSSGDEATNTRSTRKAFASQASSESGTQGRGVTDEVDAITSDDVVALVRQRRKILAAEHDVFPSRSAS